jgi:hypothetical protein
MGTPFQLCFWMFPASSSAACFLDMSAAAVVGGICPSASWQLQHAGVEDALPFSGQSLCR